MSPLNTAYKTFLKSLHAVYHTYSETAIKLEGNQRQQKYYIGVSEEQCIALEVYMSILMSSKMAIISIFMGRSL